MSQLTYTEAMERELKTERFQIVLAPSEREAVKEWRFTNRISSESESIRQLIKMGMASAEGGLPWRPIGSAPKDGRPLLIYSPGDSRGEFQIVAWEPAAHGWVGVTTTATGGSDIFAKPTHWLQLEAPNG